MIDRKAFSRNLKYFRRINNYSQAELAKKLFVETLTVSKWEMGRSFPNMDSIKNLSEVFGVSAEDMLYSDYAKRNKVVSKNKFIPRDYRFTTFVFLDFIPALYFIFPMFFMRLYRNDGYFFVQRGTLHDYGTKVTGEALVFIVLIAVSIIFSTIEFFLHNSRKLKTKIVMVTTALFVHVAFIVSSIILKQPYVIATESVIIVLRFFFMVFFAVQDKNYPE